MSALRQLAALCFALIIAAAASPASTSAARSCGAVSRQFTDGVAQVVVVKGAVKCATARGLMRRYWATRVDAFTDTVRLRFAGIRWTCRPTASDFPLRWACDGGGPRRDRFRITARE